jgi:anion-transporting  ArsA/GET3 family ATPase
MRYKTMAKQVRGVRANKPNDSKGVLDNQNLYRGKYREDVYKDEEEDNQEQQQEAQTDPTPNEVATQKSENSFAEKKAKEEDHDYKKRYDDLKKHYDTKLNEFKGEREQLASELDAVKKRVYEMPRGTTPPKTLEELEEFKERYPDVFEVVETVSNMQTESQVAKLREEIQSVKEREKNLEKEKAAEELLRLHPDFDSLRSDEKFLNWLDEQPEQLSDGIYKNNTDAKWAGKIISLYKAEMGISKKKPTRSKDSDAAASVTRQQPKDVATKDSTKKIWKGSDIARLKPWEFEKVEAEIDLARQEGRIDMNS